MSATVRVHQDIGQRELADLVVVGAGAAGMTAALIAALEGLSVVLCEASQQVGGTSATSAGTLWMPGNRHGKEAGFADTAEAADRYLNTVVGPDDERGLRQAFLESAADALDDLERRTSVHFTSSGKHPDYLSNIGAAIAGRAVSAMPFDGRLLGPDFSRVRPPLAEFLLLGGMMVGKADIQALVRRWESWPDFIHSAGLVLRYALDRLRYRRGTRLMMGNALVARLFHSLLAAGVDIRFGWRLQEITWEAGKVAGAWFQTSDGRQYVQARRGVVLATGGVGHEVVLRNRLLKTDHAIASLACDAVRGDGLQAAERIGARLEEHQPANFFWQPVSKVPRANAAPGLFPHLFLDRAKPGLIAVEARGRRFVNEAASYHHFVEGMLKTGPLGRARTWLLCDADFVRRYGLGLIPPGTRRLEPWATRGYVQIAATLRTLADQVGISPEGLLDTVERFNGFARTGVDPEFGKGQAEVDRFNGDPKHLPNPCLGTITHAPFCALEIFAADAASSAGLATDADGVVLDRNGHRIVGLYACGNDAASMMRGTYPGPGITLGPAVVFAWRIGRHAARKTQSE